MECSARKRKTHSLLRIGGGAGAVFAWHHTIKPNNVLEEILRTNRVKSADGEFIELHSAVSPDEARFLQRIISELKPVVSLEVGLAYGVSALFICDALEKTAATRHIVIDPGQLTDSWKSIGLSNLQKAGYGDIIEFHSLPSHQALPLLDARGQKIGFAFINGRHTFEHVIVDFLYIDRLLRVGGIVVLDDTVHPYPSIRKVCRFIARNRSYKVYRCLDPERRRRPSMKRRLLQNAARVSKTIAPIESAKLTFPNLRNHVKLQNFTKYTDKSLLTQMGTDYAKAAGMRRWTQIYLCSSAMAGVQRG